MASRKSRLLEKLPPSPGTMERILYDQARRNVLRPSQSRLLDTIKTTKKPA